VLKNGVSLSEYSRKEVESIAVYPDVFDSSVLTQKKKTGLIAASRSSSSSQQLKKLSPKPTKNSLKAIQNAILCEERRKQELQKRVQVISDMDYETKLHDKEKALNDEIRALEREAAALQLDSKKTVTFQMRVAKENPKDITAKKLELKSLTQKYLAKHDQVNLLDKEIETYKKRWAAFEAMIPRVHERLNTQCAKKDASSLLSFLKDLQTQETEWHPKEAKQVKQAER